jgi:dsRNA-specific ribonuclease
VILGLHKYVVYYNTNEDEISKKDVDDYLLFSHKNDFLLNQREIEPFEPPKILGDVFESVLGAVFNDGGMDAVYHVFRDMLSPLILYVAKYSKETVGEPKEMMVN